MVGVGTVRNGKTYDDSHATKSPIETGKGNKNQKINVNRHRPQGRPSPYKPMMHIACSPMSAKFINSPYFRSVLVFRVFLYFNHVFIVLPGGSLQNTGHWR